MSAPSDAPAAGGADSADAGSESDGALWVGLRRHLRDIERRLEVAFATCVTAQLALYAQNSEYDREIARTLAWGVSDRIHEIQRHLRDLAAVTRRHRADRTASRRASRDEPGRSDDTPAAEQP